MIVDVAIIGGGAGGLAAALEASKDNTNVVVLEREATLGGILNQCIHNGFGLKVFDEELTGPEYATRYIDQCAHLHCELGTTVLSIEKEDTMFVIKGSSQTKGLLTIKATSVVLSTGCYERTRGQIHLPGERPKGIMPAGSAQRYLNIDGYLVGKNIFILGSGDIGLIMARRMKLEGANVLGLAEIMPHSSGLTRNIVQCLEDFDIPLYLSHTVTNIKGKDTLESITIQRVDSNFKPIEGTEKHFEVDTLLLSVGLIPDTMVLETMPLKYHPKTQGTHVDHTFQTNIPGLFACGNALHVHDLVDDVTLESQKAGGYARRFVQKQLTKATHHIPLVAGNNVNYIIPSTIALENFDEAIECAFRVTKKANKGEFQIIQNNTIIKTQKATFLAPAEMEHITIDKTHLQDQHSPITIHLEVPS